MNSKEENNIKTAQQGEQGESTLSDCRQDDLLPSADVAEATANPACKQSVVKKKRSKVLNIVLCTVLLFLVLVLVIVIVQRYYFGSSIIVNGTSMEPTFSAGEEVWVSKNIKPKRGDVIVLYRYDVGNKFLAEFAVGSITQRNGKYEKLIKRLVALEGDKLWVEKKNGGYVLVIETAEGEILREENYKVHGQPAVFFDADGNFNESNPVTVPFLGAISSGKLGVLQGTTKEKPFVVRPGHFFYMGDNRLVSADSRDSAIKDVPMSRLIGVVA